MSPTARYLGTPAKYLANDAPRRDCNFTCESLADRPPAEIASEGPVMCLLAPEADG